MASNNPKANSRLNASTEGITIEEFFAETPTLNYVIGNVTGNRSPLTGMAQNYFAAGTYDFSGGTMAFGPGNDRS